MNMQYLSSQDLQEFEQRYPMAAAFLLRRQLQNEKRILEHELSFTIPPERKAWIQARLAELNAHFEMFPQEAKHE